MSKIVQAVNSMVSNPDNITKVMRGESELFFLYKGKYKWSMNRREDGEHYLWYYPGGESLEQLVSYDGDDWQGTAMVTYRDAEIGTKEAKASFSDLYRLLKERLYNVNEVLDDIISDDDLA